MKTFGVHPDVQTFGLIMNAWCNTGFIDEAKAALLRMKDYDLQPDVMAYSILAKGYSRQGRPEEGEALLKVMLDDKLTPNVITYTTVISGYCSLAQMDEAMRVFKEMRSWCVVPNMQTFRTLIWGFKEVRWPRRAEEILEYIRKAGYTPDMECIELVADCWRSIGVHEEAERVLAGIKPKDVDDTANETGESSFPAGGKSITKPQACGSCINSMQSCKREISFKLLKEWGISLGFGRFISPSSSSSRHGHRSSIQCSVARLRTEGGSSVRILGSGSERSLHWSCQSSWKLGQISSARSGLRGPMNAILCSRILGRVSRVVGHVVLRPPTLQTLVF